MVEFTNEAFGAKLLEAVTAGLYDGNLNCLREYIQNCIDSKATIVNVYFENGKTNLIINDNGCGMDKHELTKALQLGKSEKPDTAIGWRGIGIWSGVPTCRKIVIITKKQKYPKFRVEIDADRLRQQYTGTIPATTVLTDVTGDIEELELGNDESIQDDHFTMVRLEGILPNQTQIFTDKDVHAYLSRTIPAPFNIEKFTLGKEINKKLLEHGVEIKEVDVFFENQKIFRPPESDNLFFSNIIEKIFTIKNQVVAYGWVLSSVSNRKLTPPNKGIWFKKKGMTIGDETLVSKLSQKTYNQWQYGEIHIVNDSLKENASRNNFEANNDLLKPFYDDVGVFVNKLQRMNAYQSDNIVTRSIESLKKQVEVEDKKPMQEKITRLKMKLQQNRSFPEDAELQGIKEAIDEASKKNRMALKELEKTIEDRSNEQPIDPIQERKNRFNDFIKTAHPSLRQYLSKTTTKGKMELNLDAMDPVKILLQQKTGLKIDSICDLSKRAYDWKDVTKGDSGPILQLSTAYRDRYFGTMIFTLHDLFVNAYKHEQGKSSFAFFDTMSQEEKLEIITEFYMAQDLTLRLIEKSAIRKS